jgi:protein-L-isoaspartate(D-aspartate) O-methyltransferase
VQELVRVTRTGTDTWETQEIADVRFVPLIGKEGWSESKVRGDAEAIEHAARDVAPTLEQRIARAAEPFGDVDTADLAPLLERIGDARVVLIGEATHGTSEFYRMRNRISRALIEQMGFEFVAIEGDWPDAAQTQWTRELSGLNASGRRSRILFQVCAEANWSRLDCTNGYFCSR